MDSSIYLTPVSIPDFKSDGNMQRRRLGDIIKTHTFDDGIPSLDGARLAILGINESRNSFSNLPCSNAADIVRKHLYALFSFSHNINIIDLGNISQGETVDDTYFAVRNVIAELIDNRITPIIIGGSQDLTYANYLAYEKQGKIINLATIDSSFDLGTSEEVFDSKSYISKIILHQPNYLFNFTNIGYQSYFVDYEAVNLMRKLLFDTYRLGFIRSNMEEAEPLVRNADIVSFDLTSIRQSDAPGTTGPTPNGFYGEEACQICRYAGMSDKVSSIGFYELCPEKDLNEQTAHLTAEMIWYFIEGFYNRKGDHPHKNKTDYMKYNVQIDNQVDEIVFYKSQKSGRWWMEVPLTKPEFAKYQRHFMVPCSYRDYENASKRDIPDRWWQVYQKLM
ncbi:MAG: formimidoylglutamase [Bacteroidales bacterium]|nr:formimidoylglutamase [Bacteroidales bacterium]